MKPIQEQAVLISGASIAGLSTAWWMDHLGYKVTVVELAAQPRTAGAAIDINGATVDVVKRMGIFERLKSVRLNVEKVEFKNADDVTERTIEITPEGEEPQGDEIEIERDKIIGILYDDLKDSVEFIFSNRIALLNDTVDAIVVTFEDGTKRSFDLVIGCDGAHSGVRKLWFGHEGQYSHFLEAYFSITIVDKLLVKQKTMQGFNVPGKSVMVNAYQNKTDVIFCFVSDEEIAYDYRNTAQQREIIRQKFEGESWRCAELLGEVMQADNFYFDKFCQIKMPSWTKGRVALVGDAGYCASPAAGMGGSLSISGAAALADALQRHNGNYELAFEEYNRELRPFIEEVQARAVRNLVETFIPRTEEAIRERNSRTELF